ncbi:MAG: hypothetical protein LBV71_14945 [Prevotella sp.]|jgi:TolA-binding protein|nr:hypothetical protein [Prevotella sp.]
MNDLRKKIQENRDLFDDKEPSAGHMDRFEALLKKEQKPKSTKKVRLISILSVAASIAVLIAVAIKFYNPETMNDNIPPTATIEASEEFKTTNSYYSQQMEEQIADIMCKLAYTDTDNQAQLTKDLQKIMDNNSDFINEMAQNEDQETAIRFLVKHYKANIHALENINEKLGKYTKC